MATRSGKSSAQGTLRQLCFAAATLAAVGVVVAQNAPQVRESIEPFRRVAGDYLSVRGTQTVWDRMTRKGEKDRRIRELELEVQELSRWRQAALTMSYRMQVYEDMLNLMGELPERGVTARVVAEIDGPFAQTRLANAGQNQGVVDGAVALNEGGLVGRVIQRGRGSSRILLVTDYNSRVPVVGEVSGARGVMFGAPDGNGTLTDMPERDGFVRGERVLTSGEGGIFPQGILVGRAYDENRSWRVQLAMRNGSADYVRLIEPAIIPRPEDDPIEEVEAVADAEGEAGTDTGGAR